MSQLDLARWQFAMTSIYHFLFVPVTIGLAFLTALLPTSWYRSGRPVLSGVPDDTGRRHPGGAVPAARRHLPGAEDDRGGARAGWPVGRRVAPVTGVAVLAFAFWTHITAGKGFFPDLPEIAAVLAVFAAWWLVSEHKEGWAFAAATAAMATTILSIFVDMYPNVMVSSTNKAYNLTVSNTAAGSYVLKVVTAVVVIFLPLVLACQAWTYHVFRRRLSVDQFAAAAPVAAPSPAPGGTKVTSSDPGPPRHARPAAGRKNKDD